MKSLVLILLVLASSILNAQNKLSAYEYWFNNDYTNAQVVNFTPASHHELNTPINASMLNDGVNVFNIRYIDENNYYSSTLSKIFYKNTQTAFSNKNLVAYEYWFNNDYNNAQVVNFTPASHHELNTPIDASMLNDGVNVFNIRYIDENNYYSSTVSKFFYKNTQTAFSNKNLVAYEYWFNNDYNNAQLVNFTPAAQHELNTPIDASLLNDGVNVFNIRYLDENNYYSSTISKMFYKKENTIINNKIFGYHYWFDNDFNNKIYVPLLTPSASLQILDSIDLRNIPKGEHSLHFQFHDSLNVWSLVTTDTIQKLPFPIADFTFASSGNCDSTTINFTDNSIDGDTYLWDFGDGDTSNVISPTHTYHITGVYNISLTVTDTTTNLDSTIIIPIDIKMNTTSTIQQTACNSFISPSGNYVWTSSNTYLDTIPNSNNCDSIITINLTINNVDTSVTQNSHILNSNATSGTFQWLDCNNNYTPILNEINAFYTATANGSFAVEVTQNGCVDTSLCYDVITINIDEVIQAEEFTVYPNPSTGIFNIYSSVNNVVIMELFDIVGKQIISPTYIYNGKNNFDVSKTPKGIYFINIKSENQNYSLRLIIQ